MTNASSPSGGGLLRKGAGDGCPVVLPDQSLAILAALSLACVSVCGSVSTPWGPRARLPSVMLAPAVVCTDCHGGKAQMREIENESLFIQPRSEKDQALGNSNAFLFCSFLKWEKVNTQFLLLLEKQDANTSSENGLPVLRFLWNVLENTGKKKAAQMGSWDSAR